MQVRTRSRMQLELEAVARRIHELLGKQAQLRKRKATLETSRADAHKSGVSMQRAANTPTTSTPCVSLHRPRAPGTRSSQMAFTPAPGNHGPWVQQRKTRSRPRATTSPPPVFDISSRNRFAPLCETDRDAVVIGDSIVRHVRATLAKGKVHTHCLPGARVLDVSVQIPAILKDDESVAAAADGDTEEGLQEPGRDGTQHIARGDDHRVRTSSHVSTRTRKVQ